MSFKSCSTSAMHQTKMVTFACKEGSRREQVGKQVSNYKQITTRHARCRFFFKDCGELKASKCDHMNTKTEAKLQETTKHLTLSIIP
jgi:hypothetical protein